MSVSKMLSYASKVTAQFLLPLMVLASCATQKFDKYGVAQVKDPKAKEIEAVLSDPDLKFYQDESGIMKTPIKQVGKDRGIYILSLDGGVSSIAVGVSTSSIEQNQAYNQGFTKIKDGVAVDSKGKTNELAQESWEILRLKTENPLPVNIAQNNRFSSKPKK